MFSVPVWLAEALGSMLLAGICGAMYAKGREKFMAYWLLGWVLVMPAASLMSLPEVSAPIAVLYEVPRIAACYFLLRGNHEFYGRPIPRIYERWAAATLAWALSGFHPCITSCQSRTWSHSSSRPSSSRRLLS
ncbi:MAG: hypothetical protein WD024_04075 [Bacillota bacterium]